MINAFDSESNVFERRQMKSYLRAFIKITPTIFLLSLGTVSLFWSLVGCKEEVPTGIYDNIHDPQASVFRPYSPTSLSMAGQTSSSVTLEWADSSKYVSGFLIQKRTAGGAFFAPALLSRFT